MLIWWNYYFFIFFVVDLSKSNFWNYDKQTDLIWRGWGYWSHMPTYKHRYDALTEEAFFFNLFHWQASQCQWASSVTTAQLSCCSFLLLFYYPLHLSHSVFSSPRVRWPRLCVIASGLISVWWLFSWTEHNEWETEDIECAEKESICPICHPYISTQFP